MFVGVERLKPLSHLCSLCRRPSHEPRSGHVDLLNIDVAICGDVRTVAAHEIPSSAVRPASPSTENPEDFRFIVHGATVAAWRQLLVLMGAKADGLSPSPKNGRALRRH